MLMLNGKYDVFTPVLFQITFCSLLVYSAFFSMSAWALTPQQQTFIAAEQALKKHQYNRYAALRDKLDAYPLSIYLDYETDISEFKRLPGAKAAMLIDKYQVTPLYQKLRSRYLFNAGQQQRWDDFLIISPDAPNDIRLQCYYYQAKLVKGDIQTGYQAAESLWTYGKSRPKECDVLFNQWTKAGKRTQAIIWARMLLSFDARQTQLLHFLSQKITVHSKEAKRLLAVYKDPNRLRRIQDFSDTNPIVGDIVAAGLKRLARKDLDRAILLFTQYQALDRFSSAQARQVQQYIVKRILIKQDETHKEYVDSVLADINNDYLFEKRLRWAIGEQDTPNMIYYLSLLKPETRQQEQWQYWLSRINAQYAPESANQVLANLSNERNFYGFAASQSLNKPISLNQTRLLNDTQNLPPLEADEGFVRVKEFMALNRYFDARAEWLMLIKRHDNLMKSRYGRYAQAQGWYDFGVEASIQGKLWDDIELRFPMAHKAIFKKASRKYNVKIEEILAITRRESAFSPYATSGVGARGLMQIMPATAKATAKRHGARYRKPTDLYRTELNLTLGSAYYAQLLKQFNNNRILATAAYNAGPSRVRRWLADSNGTLDVMSFIEAIPF